MKLSAKIIEFILDIYRSRQILFELSKRDFKQRYLGSYLGIFWAFAQPLVLMLMLYLIVSQGLRGPKTMQGLPFGVYLVSGLIAWWYFAENLNQSSSAILAHQYLVKKANFRLSILPIVKLWSSLVPHLFLLAVAVVLTYFNGYTPTLYLLQLFYYLTAMIALLLGICWLTSSVSLFVADIRQVVSIIVQFGFWLTPLFWDPQGFPEKYRRIVELNPMCYIVSGYRDSLTGQSVFWDKPIETAYFWSLVAMFMVLGITTYHRLRPHFAEVV